MRATRALQFRGPLQAADPASEGDSNDENAPTQPNQPQQQQSAPSKAASASGPLPRANTRSTAANVAHLGRLSALRSQQLAIGAEIRALEAEEAAAGGRARPPSELGDFVGVSAETPSDADGEDEPDGADDAMCGVIDEEEEAHPRRSARLVAAEAGHRAERTAHLLAEVRRFGSLFAWSGEGLEHLNFLIKKVQRSMCQRGKRGVDNGGRRSKRTGVQKRVAGGRVLQALAASHLVLDAGPRDVGAAKRRRVKRKAWRSA